MIIITVKSSSETLFFSAFSFNSSTDSAELMRCSREKMSGDSGLVWNRLIKPPYQLAREKKCE